MSTSRIKRGGRERRIFPAWELRTDTQNKRARILGNAAVFGQLSEDLGGFREIIEPGFFRNVLSGDTRALWNHNADLVLGRTRNGTLILKETAQALEIITYPPDTTWARDALVSIRRGDVDQMSFQFQVRKGGDAWEEQPGGAIVRRLLPGGCEYLLDVSPVTFPAYPTTSVEARALVATSKPHVDERTKMAFRRYQLELAEKRFSR